MKKLVYSPDRSQFFLINRYCVNGKNYDYYLTLFSKGLFNAKYVNDNFKQKEPINSLKKAIETANNYFNSL